MFPQVGFPHIEPVISVANVKQAPIGAHALAIISASVCRKTIEMKLQTAIKVYVESDNQAHGTCTYIILTVSP